MVVLVVANQFCWTPFSDFFVFFWHAAAILYATQVNTFPCWENHHPRCENEEKWRKIWEEERAEIQKAEAEAQAELGSPCAEMFTFNSCM